MFWACFVAPPVVWAAAAAQSLSQPPTAPWADPAAPDTGRPSWASCQDRPSTTTSMDNCLRTASAATSSPPQTPPAWPPPTCNLTRDAAREEGKGFKITLPQRETQVEGGVLAFVTSQCCNQSLMFDDNVWSGLSLWSELTQSSLFSHLNVFSSLHGLLPEQMDCAWSSSNQPLGGSIMTKTNLSIFYQLICIFYLLYTEYSCFICTKYDSYEKE